MYIVDYVDDLFTCLERHLLSHGKPSVDDPKVATLASKGQGYTSLDDLAKEQEAWRRGIAIKPHYLTTDEIALAKKRCAKESKKTK